MYKVIYELYSSLLLSKQQINVCKGKNGPVLETEIYLLRSTKCVHRGLAGPPQGVLVQCARSPALEGSLVSVHSKHVTQ